MAWPFFGGVVCNLLCNIWGRVREMLGLCRVGGWSKNTTLALYIICERPVASMKLIQCTVCWRVYSWLCQCLARRVINLHASLPRLTQLPDSKKETWSELVGSTVYHSSSVVCFCVEPGLSASLTESVTLINCPHYNLDYLQKFLIAIHFQLAQEWPKAVCMHQLLIGSCTRHKTPRSRRIDVMQNKWFIDDKRVEMHVSRSDRGIHRHW